MPWIVTTRERQESGSTVVMSFNRAKLSEKHKRNFNFWSCTKNLSFGKSTSDPWSESLFGEKSTSDPWSESLFGESHQLKINVGMFAFSLTSMLPIVP